MLKGSLTEFKEFNSGKLESEVGYNTVLFKFLIRYSFYLDKNKNFISIGKNKER